MFYLLGKDTEHDVIKLPRHAPEEDSSHLAERLGQLSRGIVPTPLGWAVRVRKVEYSPGYLADHWCDRGHILFVYEGVLDTELKDGRVYTLKPGMSYQVSDNGDSPHRSRTEIGAKLFVVD